MDIEPRFGGTDFDPKEAEEPLLAKEIEGEWPGITERDRRVVADVGDRELGASVPRLHENAPDRKVALRRVGEIDTGRFGEPGAESIVRRPRVHEAQLRRILEILDQYGDDWAE
jgi:hypothetical protein